VVELRSDADGEVVRDYISAVSGYVSREVDVKEFKTIIRNCFTKSGCSKPDDALKRRVMNILMEFFGGVAELTKGDTALDSGLVQVDCKIYLPYFREESTYIAKCLNVVAKNTHTWTMMN
jgi:hypothetical protein